MPINIPSKIQQLSTLQSCIMFSIFKRNPIVPTQNPTQVIENIDGVLDAILDMCTVNMHLLTHEERSSFMDEYRRYRLKLYHIIHYSYRLLVSQMLAMGSARLYLLNIAS